MKLILTSAAVILAFSAGLTDARRGAPKKNNLDYEVCYEWTIPKFQYPEGVNETELKRNGSLEENNVLISAVTVYEDLLFLTTPRYRTGVPSTLNTVKYDRQQGQNCSNGTATSPLLVPFPSYEMNQEGNCSHLIMVQATKVDQYGRLWAADAGRTNLLSLPPINQCPAKLVVFDLKNGNQVVHTYVFPDSVVPQDTNIIKDLLVNCTSESDCTVLIADIGKSRMVIYDMKSNDSWTAQHPTMNAQLLRVPFIINGVPTAVPFGVNGIMVSPKSTNYEYFYYTPIASKKLFRVNTSVLTDPARKNNSRLSNSDVTDLGPKISQTDGFAVDDEGNVYFGSLTESAVYKTKLPTSNSDRGALSRAEYVRLNGNTKDFLWPDVISFDNRGGMVMTTTKFHIFTLRGNNPRKVNYRIILFKTGGNAYNV